MDVGKEVEGAIREGQRIQEAVRDITLKALTQRELDFAAMRKVTREALDAVRVVDDEPLGHAGAHRVTHDSRGAQPHRIHEREQIGRHVREAISARRAM